MGNTDYMDGFLSSFTLREGLLKYVTVTVPFIPGTMRYHDSPKKQLSLLSTSSLQLQQHVVEHFVSTSPTVTSDSSNDAHLLQVDHLS